MYYKNTKRYGMTISNPDGSVRANLDWSGKPNQKDIDKVLAILDKLKKGQVKTTTQQ